MEKILLNLREQFKIGNQNFSLKACRWKSVNFKQNCEDDELPNKSLNIIPNIRIGQTAVILSNHIYIFGGLLSNMKTQNFCAVNLKNYRWHRMNAKQNPKSRNSHGIALLKNQIYLFAGSNQMNYFNDLHSFNNFTNAWTKIQNQGQIPQPRDPMIFLGIKNDYLLLVGGINQQSRKYYQDAFIWYKNTWKKLEKSNYPRGLVGAKACECGGRIYLFGGIKRQTGQYNSKFYEIIMKDKESMMFQQIGLSVQIFPESRIHHQMIAINHQYFVLIGGQNINKKIFKDIWVFDAFSLKWMRIEPKNGPLKGIHSFSAVFHNNTIYLIGGILQNRQTINDQIISIEFANEDIFKSQICGKCLNIIEKKQKQSKKYPKKLNISVGFLYNLALEIKFPFHAISMIYEASKLFNPTYFRLKQQKTISNFDYLRFQFNGCSFGFKEFEEFITHKNLTIEMKKFTLDIKLGSFRLGKTFLFVSTDRKYRYVYLLSAESRISPHFDETYIYYAYIQNIELQRIQTQEGTNQKSLILNILKSYILCPQIHLSIPEKNLLLIFQNKIVMTAEKNYLNQIIMNKDDFMIWKNDKKIQFLEERGYQINYDIEISLHTYLTLYNLNPNQKQLPFYLNDDSDQVRFTSYKVFLNNLFSQKLIFKVCLPKIEGMTLSGEIYLTQSHNLIQNNFGLLIYSNGKLLNRYGTEFGKLFSKHFYKTKYKKATTIFYELGFVNIINLQQNMFKNQFIKKQYYCRLLQQIQMVCNLKKNHLDTEIDQNQQYKLAKRLKI